jgi:hypothetical protein
MLAQGGYENAPATHMLATHCILCGRALLDAVSVERGIGPVCRRKTGYDEPVDEAARARGNKLVHAIATQQSSLPASIVQQYLDELEEIGFGRLVQAILDALVMVRIDAVPNAVRVRAPYSEELFTVRGRRWLGQEVGNQFPEESKPQLFAALKRAFPGKMAHGPKGLFRM